MKRNYEGFIPYAGWRPDPPGSPRRRGRARRRKRSSDDHGLLQLSTGDLFRAPPPQGTELGKRAQEYMSTGRDVPDEVTIEMVRERLAELDARDGVMFDGFPRTVAQAEASTRSSERGESSGAAARGPREELMARLGARATCSQCRRSTRWQCAAEALGVCDRCGRNGHATRADDRRNRAEAPRGLRGADRAGHRVLRDRQGAAVTASASRGIGARHAILDRRRARTELISR